MFFVIISFLITKIKKINNQLGIMITFINNCTINFLEPKHTTDSMINLSGTAIISGIGMKCIAFLAVIGYEAEAALWTMVAAKARDGKMALWTVEYASTLTTISKTKAAMTAVIGTKIALGLIGFGVVVLAISLVAKLILKTEKDKKS